MKGNNKNLSNEKSRKRAFTLAEALIAIAIIGVVAALVIPPCIQKYKKVVYSARLKRFYSAMNQAITLYNTENATESRYWNVPRQPNNSSTAAKVFWETYFAKNFSNVVKTEVVRESNQYHFYVYFKDGTKLRIQGGDGTDFHYCLNKKTCFAFYFSYQTKKLTPYIWNLNTNRLNDRNYILNQCKNHDAYCTQLLYLDNWEFKSDYPRKL